METREFIRQIDKEMYILKNKIMAGFDKQYHTKLRTKDADKISFLDILQAPHNVNADDLYQSLHQLAGHGIPANKRDLFYQHTGNIFSNDGMNDFEAMIDEISQKCNLVNNQCNVYACGASNQTKFIFDYLQTPLPILECFVEMPYPFEALLLQNGNVMIMKSIPSVSAFIDGKIEKEL